MDSEIEKYEKKQSQLSEQIEKLFVEKQKLEDKINVLNECLSLEKVKEKIFQLENKQKILTTLETMVNNLKVEIKPLDYLKQLLQRELMVSTLPTNDDCNIKEQINMESSLLTVNSECAFEISDSLSNVSSEESVMVLSEYDVVSDEEDLNNTEKTVDNKVMYDEALQMASSVHLTVEKPITNIESISIPNDQVKDLHFVQSTSKDMIALINSSSKSEQLLDMYSIMNKQNFQNHKENEDIKLECTNRQIEPILQKSDQPSIFNKEQLDMKGHDNLSISVNDSWVKVDTNESFDSSIESNMEVKIQDKLIPKVKYNACNGQSCIKQSESKDICEMKNIKNVSNCIDHNSVNETHNLINLTNVTKDEIISISPLLNTENYSLPKEYGEKKGNTDVEIHVQNNQLYNHQFESRINSEIKFKNVCNKLENIYNHVNSNKSTCSANILKDKIDTDKYNLSTYINNDEKTTESRGLVDFNNMGLNERLWNGIRYTGFQNLMTLQLECLSRFINGCNVFLHSYPCVGKSTICFISVLQRIDTSLNFCQAIILVPTLELSLSALKMVKSLGKFLNVSVCIGDSYIPIVSPVSHVMICTPHNLCDIIRSNSLCKDFIKMLIIDDADEMLKSSAFFNQMRQILLFFNNELQLIILSSSKFEEILDFFSDTLPNPEYIIMSDERPSLDTILQYYICLPEELKFDAICELYDTLNLMFTVVYCNTWNKSLEVAEKMRLIRCSVSTVNNEMDTSQRRVILRQFRSGTSRVLVTTELLRGEDFTDVVWVINYDLPENPKDYVRRIVSCFDRRVKVINFISPNDKIAKENIETMFNVQMHYLPQDVTNLRVPNLNFSNNSILSLLEL